MNSPAPAARPSVAIWKQDWLPASETFIRNQLGALTRWRPLRLGRLQTSEPLVPADYAPFSSAFGSKVIWQLTGTRLHAAGYQRALAEADSRVVHAHFATGGIEALPLARRAGLPLAVTFHGSDVTVEPELGAPGSRRRARLDELLQQADALIAVSNFIADRLISLGAPPAKVVVRHIGIPVSADPEPPEATERSGILFVGRLTGKKGVSDLLQAVALLPPPLRGVPLRIVGDGPLRAELEQQARSSGLSVEFLGRRSSGEVAALMAGARVFCAPSKTGPDGDSEGFGMVFLEAALSGAPVVAYRHGGVVESVLDGETGLLSEPGDLIGLAASLERVLTDPELAQQLGSRGRQRVLADFDVTRLTGELELLYDALAAGRAGSIA